MIANRITKSINLEFLVLEESVPVGVLVERDAGEDVDEGDAGVVSFCTVSCSFVVMAVQPDVEFILRSRAYSTIMLSGRGEVRVM